MCQPHLIFAQESLLEVLIRVIVSPALPDIDVEVNVRVGPGRHILQRRGGLLVEPHFQIPMELPVPAIELGGSHRLEGVLREHVEDVKESLELELLRVSK